MQRFGQQWDMRVWGGSFPSREPHPEDAAGLGSPCSCRTLSSLPALPGDLSVSPRGTQLVPAPPGQRINPPQGMARGSLPRLGTAGEGSRGWGPLGPGGGPCQSVHLLRDVSIGTRGRCSGRSWAHPSTRPRGGSAGTGGWRTLCGTQGAGRGLEASTGATSPSPTPAWSPPRAPHPWRWGDTCCR